MKHRHRYCCESDNASWADLLLFTSPTSLYGVQLSGSRSNRTQRGEDIHSFACPNGSIHPRARACLCGLWAVALLGEHTRDAIGGLDTGQTTHMCPA